MSLGDNIRKFFSKKRNPGLNRLQGWAAGRRGLEGYIEPQTATEPTTLLLVDRDGDHVRAPIQDPRDGVTFCEGLGIPVYDASVIGYPKRMREFKQGEIDDAVDRQIAEIERRLREGGGDAPNN